MTPCWPCVCWRCKEVGPCFYCTSDRALSYPYLIQSKLCKDSHIFPLIGRKNKKSFLQAAQNWWHCFTRSKIGWKWIFISHLDKQMPDGPSCIFETIAVCAILFMPFTAFFYQFYSSSTCVVLLVFKKNVSFKCGQNVKNGDYHVFSETLHLIHLSSTVAPFFAPLSPSQMFQPSIIPPCHVLLFIFVTTRPRCSF